MIQPPPTSHQARKPFLVPLEGGPQGHIPRGPEVSPHHEAVLEVRQYQTIIERAERLLPKHPSSPAQDPQQSPNLGPDPFYMTRPPQLGPAVVNFN